MHSGSWHDCRHTTPTHITLLWVFNVETQSMKRLVCGFFMLFKPPSRQQRASTQMLFVIRLIKSSPILCSFFSFFFSFFVLVSCIKSFMCPTVRRNQCVFRGKHINAADSAFWLFFSLSPTTQIPQRVVKQFLPPKHFLSDASVNAAA